LAERISINWEQARASLRRAEQFLEQPAVSPSERERVFRERARALAHAPAEPVDQAAREQMIVFRLGRERFALPLSDLSEVISRPAIARVPGAPEEIAGVMQVRGEIRPVFDLCRFLRIEELSQATVLMARSRQKELGLKVGQVDEIRKFGEENRDTDTQSEGPVAYVTFDLIQILSLDGLVKHIEARFGKI
jgi:chemotaxis signal transduction protein